ncbi:hypothetical protein AVEN_158258-1 [Araneus ventricosus]|uniref:Uncharacterized protein n=1 Tax=Araneus ventricosus TaxID=182803 RepID=A0A4Y2G4U6_ARAVE|nr:hypothetical protein AVEN_158258-1 [Araneus ventricosus]
MKTFIDFDVQHSELVYNLFLSDLASCRRACCGVCCLLNHVVWQTSSQLVWTSQKYPQWPGLPRRVCTKPDSTDGPPYVGLLLLNAMQWPTSSSWCDAKTLTLARPTKKGVYETRFY